jgi:hypothetical protein
VPPNKKTRRARRSGAPSTRQVQDRSSAERALAHDRKQERLDARRRAKAEAMEARRKAERRQRLVRTAVISLLAAGAVWFFLVQTQPPATPDSIRGHAVRELGESGVNDHVTGAVDYDSSPPVSGPHASQPAPCGVHSEPIPNENQVHSLEHGAVGIQYQPDVDPEDIAAIERIVRRFESGVFSAPYPDMETPIAVSSWGELMALDDLDVPAINAYIEEFRGGGPEDATCPNTVDSPFQAPASGSEDGGGGGDGESQGE